MQQQINLAGQFKAEKNWKINDVIKDSQGRFLTELLNILKQNHQGHFVLETQMSDSLCLLNLGHSVFIKHVLSGRYCLSNEVLKWSQ